MTSRGKILITGGNGFIGSVVVRTLLSAGYPVRCLLRETSRTDRIDGLDFERVTGDVRDRESLERAMDGCEGGCDGVIHLASLSAWDEIDSPLMDDVVIGGTRNLLAAARAHSPAPRVVFVSSVLAVNGSRRPRPFDEGARFELSDKLNYSRCKRAAEALCRQAFESGLPVVIVNPAEVYGPNDSSFITAGNLVDFAKSKPVLVCHGGTSVVYVDDVAVGIMRALERGRPGERYILGGENLTVRELARICLDILGLRRRPIVTLPNGVLKVVTKVATRLGVPLPYNPRVIPYATNYWFMDSSKASRELGVTFRPARDALAPTLAWLRESGHIA